MGRRPHFSRWTSDKPVRAAIVEAMILSFPRGFLWGAATSGYQIEGASNADGKGPSIWDTFVKVPGKILHGDTGNIACNTYDPKQLEADLDLAARLGLKAFIFSVQWPRIQPEGRGGVNAKGLDYYRRLVDGLQARGIAPALTLYHWELPQALEDQGGWLNRDTAERFAEYSTLLYDALATQVPIWITQNEPHTTAWLGYGYGKHAPGVTGVKNALTAAHHLLLSHGLAIKTLRGRVAGAKTGFGAVLNVTPARPVRPDSAADRLAATRFDGDQNRLFLDPIFKGEYPADVLEYRQGEAGGWKFIRPGDLETIHAPVDFLGVNYYTPTMIAAGPQGQPEWRPNSGPLTAMGWSIDPAGLHETLTRVQTEYTGNLPLYVSENGASFRDYLNPEGECRDPERVDFLHTHLREAHRAIADGMPLAGYFVWSLLDNFEWDSAYRERFGLVYIDYATQRRVPKGSFGWYQEAIKQNGVEA